VDLILWRHAQAERGARDLSRRLTPKGRKQAARVARWLRKRLPEGFAVIASPAVRARDTARALGEPVKLAERLAPGAAPPEILAAAGWPGRGGTVVLVGHQPDLGRTAALLVQGREGDWSVRKGGLWWLRGRARGGEVEVVVRAVLSPDLV
jgi:phosphohistidine phosphatase